MIGKGRQSEQGGGFDQNDRSVCTCRALLALESKLPKAEHVIVNPASSRVRDRTTFSAAMKIRGLFALRPEREVLFTASKAATGAQDNNVAYCRLSSHALAYFHET
jgi:hypothetical protein